METSAILWVSAYPGCGKSALAKYFVDEVLSSNATKKTCYFFFKDDFDDQKSPETALCCILHQLFVQRPALLLERFLDKVSDHVDQFFSSFNELWHMLIEATSQDNGGEIVVILDALDECVEYERLTAALTQLYDKDRGASSLKFLVTSRLYPKIGQELQHLKESQPSIHLDGDNRELNNKIAREINIVIKRRVRELGQRHKLQSEERTYLWIRLVFAAMEDAIFFSKADMRAKIHEMPHTVEDA
ncbi:ankyrin repeat-containing domain protein [Apiospora saccharicola]